MKKSNKIHIYARAEQRGAVLIMSLLVLLVLTIIGVNALQTSTLDTKIVANFKEQVTAFHVAETTLELTFIDLASTGIGDFEKAIMEKDQILTADEDTGLNKSSDLSMSATTAKASIEMIGEGTYAKGSSVGKFLPMRFVVTGEAVRTGSRAQETHQRGVEILVPGS